MKTRVKMTPGAVDAIVERRGAAGAAATAKFLESKQKELTRSRRLRDAITSDYGRDARGWWARAGMKDVRRTPAFFWYFEEFQTGRGGGQPFLRPALENNTPTVVRLFTRGGL